MKHIIFTACGLAIAFGASTAMAQSSTISTQRTDDEKGLIETIAKIEKKTDAFNLYLNMHGSGAFDFNGKHFDEFKFQMKQLRVEAKGNINPMFNYRFRMRLNKGDQPSGYRDNILNSIDIAGFGMNIKKWSFFLGKQCASYGGIEFDLNPIEIYQYSDMVDYMSNFMSGVNIAYNFTPRQQLQFQVLNAYNQSSSDMYGDYEKAKIPLVYTLNWNGNFGDVYKTRWSASYMNETKKTHMWYFALGNDFNISDKVQMYFDWMYSIEGVDRKGIITSMFNEYRASQGKEAMKYNAAKTDIMSFILHANYRFHPAWNIFGKMMIENEGVYSTHEQLVGGNEAPFTMEKGRYRTAYGYIGGIEYYPFKDRNLHFFAAYVGRHYSYSDRAKALGQKSYNTNRFSLGFIWQMPVF